MKRLAIVHTTPATVESLKALANELLPDYQVINFVDDSILPDLVEDINNMPFVKQKIIQYMKFAEESGADIILNACSSVGEVVSAAEKEVSIPVVRIDEAMAEKAINEGEKISVAATLPTTLHPTKALLEAKAEEAGKNITLKSEVFSEAYQNLQQGNKEKHDQLLADALERMAKEADLIVLAQASMANVVPRLPESLQSKFLSSPRLGMLRVIEKVGRPN